MAKVILDNLVKKFGDLEVVHGINLEVNDIELLVLVGPSGCGKSTTLRMVAGLEDISGGKILIGDRVVNGIAPKDRNVAMVFQNYALYPHMNVFDNMSFGLKVIKTPQTEINKRVQEAAESLGLNDLLERRPFELSGGQRQRVAMGRAIVRNPSVFLFDEPLSNLDATLRIQMRTEIKLLHQKIQSTIIYVTHDQVEAMTLADRIVVMRDGYIEQVGKPLELFRKPTNTFVAGFIGAPPMNLIPGKIVYKNGGLKIDCSGQFEFPVPEKAGADIQDGMHVIMGLRPEDLTIENGGSELPKEWKVTGIVEVVEPLGSETYVQVNVQGVKLKGKSLGRRSISTGNKINLVMDLEHLYIFDAKTSSSIY